MLVVRGGADDRVLQPLKQHRLYQVHVEPGLPSVTVLSVPCDSDEARTHTRPIPDLQTVTGLAGKNGPNSVDLSKLPSPDAYHAVACHYARNV